jgi:Na+/H+-dicarboxylate symporter
MFTTSFFIDKEKIMKLELHWQILIGLVLGIIFGIVFPTNFKITDESITELKDSDLPDELI